MIDKLARDEDVSLIVIGAQGRNATADVLLGSVSDQVVCRHVRPVLVARSRVEAIGA
jgi:nucleotide-binding universal stress UspA family protein